MARMIHLVVSQHPDYHKTVHIVHGAFTQRKNAAGYTNKLNKDQMDEEALAYVDSVAICDLEAEWIKDKICYLVEFDQESMTKCKNITVKACPYVNTEASYKRETKHFEWRGWAKTPWDAQKKAQLAAMSSWRQSQ